MSTAEIITRKRILGSVAIAGKNLIAINSKQPSEAKKVLP